jgi:hypothetical protein
MPLDKKDLRLENNAQDWFIPCQHGYGMAAFRVAQDFGWRSFG